MANDNDKPTLTRRRVLGGIGAAGIAAGGAGLLSSGTFSQFIDSAQVAGKYTAGALDGEIKYSASYNGNDNGSSDGYMEALPVDEGKDPVYAFTVDDLKPGDYGSIVFEIHNKASSNPAWVLSCLGIDNSTEGEGGVTKPEKLAGDNDDTGAGSGELAKNMALIPFYDTNLDSSFFDSDKPDGVDTRQVTDYGDGTAIHFWDNANEELSPKFLTDIVDTTVAQGTVNWNEGSEVNEYHYDPTYNGCVLLNGDQDTADPEDNNTQAANPISTDETINFGYDWHLPYTVGNKAQTDTLTILFGFNFQQYRHNSTPQQPDTYNPGVGT